MQTRDYLRELLTIFFIRRTIILAITAAILLMGLTVAMLWPPSYQAEGAIVLKGGRILQDPTGLGNDVREEMENINEEDLFSEMEILSSRTVFRATAERVRGNPEFGLETADEAALNRFTGRIANAFEASLVPRSNVIRARLTWDEWQAAETLLKVLFEAYKEHRQQVYNPRATEQFFQNQIVTFRDNVAAIEDRLLAMTDGRRLDEIDAQIANNVDLINSLRRTLADLEQDRIVQTNLVSFLDNAVATERSTFYTAIDSLPLADLAQRVQEIYGEEAKVLQTYKSGTEPAAAIEQQVSRMQALLRGEAQSIAARERSNLETVSQRIAAINSRITGLQAENASLNRMASNARQVERELEIAEETMRTFERRHQEARIKNETMSDLFTIGEVQRPQASATAVFPNPSRILPVALIIGLLLGLTVGFLIESFDHSFKRPEDLRSYANLPYLFSVPKYT